MNQKNHALSIIVGLFLVVMLSAMALPLGLIMVRAYL